MTDQTPVLNRSVLARLGLTPGQLIIIVIILVNGWLIYNGHQEVSADVLRVQSYVSQQVAQHCPAYTAGLP